MATSGYKSITVTEWDTLKFSWWESTQSVEANQTTIGWKLELIATAYGYINSSASKEWAVTVNGTKYSGTNTIGINNNSTKTLASGYTNIPHDADGEKTFSYSFSQEFNMTFNGWVGTKSGSGTGVLDPIPRASQPSCITWPEHTLDVGYFGDTISIHMNRNSSAFTHTVRYTFGPAQALMKGTIATGVTTGTTWKIPLDFMNVIPYQTEASGRIYVDTYNGTKLIGTKYCLFQAKVPTSVKPSVHLALEDVTGIDDIYGSPVQGLSKIKVTVTPTLAYKSPIASYSIAVDGLKYTSTPITTGTLRFAGDSTVAVSVKDGRGRFGFAQYTMNVQAYTPPSVSALAVRRCTEDGTADDQGDHIKVSFTAAITSLNGKNPATYTLRYKKGTDETFTDEVLSDYTNVYQVEDGSHIFEADEGSTYDVELVATDRHGSAMRSTSASTAFSLLNFGADGRSIGIYKAAERPGMLDIGGDVHLNGHALYGAHGMEDTRNANETPEWYMETYGKGSVWEFKKMTAVGFTSPAAAFGPMETIIPWKDSSGGLPRQVIYENRTRWTRIASSLTTWGAWQSDALIAYPVGSIYIAYNHTNPGTLFGGTWVRMTGGFLWASNATDTIGQTGGEKTHTLTVNELPSHSHGSVYSQHASGTKDKAWYNTSGSSVAYGAVATGGGAAHNNMPPYIQVSIWRRTA